MVKSVCLFSLSVLLLLMSACHAESDVLSVEPYLSDGAVLQQNSSLKVVGTASPGSLVTVSSDWDFSMSTTAGMDSTWSVWVTTPGADLERHRIVVHTSSSSVSFSDILIGEVWLAIGQAPEPDADAFDYSDIDVGSDSLARFFEIEKGTSAQPQRSFNGRWKLLSPANFNGVGRISLSFIEQLRDSLGIPVGVLIAAYPDAPGKSWVGVDDIDDENLRNEAEEKISQYEQSHAECAQWLKGLNTLPLSQAAGVYDEYVCVSHFDSDVWPEMQTPGLWGWHELPGFNGVVWFFRDVDLPRSWAGRRLALFPGRLGGSGMVYVNQTPVGEFNADNLNMRGCMFEIPASVTRSRPERMSLAVRMLGTEWRGGFYGNADGSPMRIDVLPEESGVSAAEGDTSVRIDGKWHYYAAALRDGDSLRLLGMPDSKFMGSFRQSLAVPYDMCGAVANKMVAPLAGKSVAGVLCNVGEREDDPESVSRNMPLIVKSVRHMLENPDLPFLIPQSGRVMRDDAGSDGIFGNGVREAQMSAALNIPNVHIVSTLDLEKREWRVVDYARQREVGKRLARLALSSVYGRDFECFPTPLDAVARRQVINVRFACADGLRVDLDLPTAFEVAGADSVFYPARALAGESSLTVFSHMVPAPRFVRYVHHDSMQPTLWNVGGMPAPSFFFRASPED